MTTSRWVGLTLGDGAVDGLAVVGAVGDHRGECTGDLREQGSDLGSVALLVARQLAGEDLAAVGVDREMEFAPLPPAALAVLRDQPLASAVNLQALARHSLGRGPVPRRV